MTVGQGHGNDDAAEAARIAAGGGQPIHELDPDRDLRRKDREQDITLRRTYAFAILLGLGAQMTVADVGFLWYLIDMHGRVPGYVMDAWLGATVVQVIGVILVITRSLFPTR